MSHIAEVIQYEGDNSTFVWKHPCEDFNSLTQLIVHESQEAVFFMNGQALDLFGPGRYTLETENIPLIGKLLNRITGDKSPFHCEVYFVNRTEQMAIKWGTNSKVQFLEPAYHFPVQLGASGEMSLRAEDSRKLLVKLVGTECLLNQEGLTKYFRAFLMTRVKTYLARVIREQKISIFEIDEHLESLSSALLKLLRGDFLDYGIALERFFVTNIVKPDGDPSYERYKSLYFRQYADVAEANLQKKVGIINAETEAQKTVIASKALAEKRVQEGYTYQQERGFDVAGAAAANEGTGQFTNMGIGLGMMSGIGGTVGGVVEGAVSSALNGTDVSQAVLKCPKCGAVLPAGAKFCLNCGEKAVPVPEQSDQTVLCPHCGKRVSKGKFCSECGYQLTVICPKCGKELPGDTKFCPECGKKI